MPGVKNIMGGKSMYYNFNTQDERLATGALLVYAIYRSRNMKRFKVSPDMWGMIERAVRSASKRAENLYDFIEKLKPKLQCETIQPRWAKTMPDGVVSMKMMEDGSFAEVEDQGRRQFLTDVFNKNNHMQVISVLRKYTSTVVYLVRDRLEREKPYEVKFKEEIIDAE